MEIISIHPTLPEPMQWLAALKLRASVLWGQEDPPATAEAYAEADVRSEHLACVPPDPWNPDGEAAEASDGEIWGVISLDGDRLRQLAVREDKRGRGIGRALVEAAVARRKVAVAGDDAGGAVSAGGAVGGAVTVRAWTASRAFYERLGFSAVGAPYVSKGQPCVELARPLAWAPPPPPPPPPARRRFLAVAVFVAYAEVLRRCERIRARVDSPAALSWRLRSGVLDLVPFGLFDQLDVRDLCDELGADGREEHMALYASGADVAFPLLYTALLLAFRTDRLAAAPAALLVCPGACDLLANACHYAALAAHPEPAAPAVYAVAVLAEAAKWATSLCVAAAFFFAGAAARRAASAPESP